MEELKKDYEEIISIISKHDQVVRHDLLKNVHGYFRQKRDIYVEEETAKIKDREEQLNHIKNLEY